MLTSLWSCEVHVRSKPCPWQPHPFYQLDTPFLSLTRRFRTVKWLLNRGADPCLTDDHGNTALHQALRYGRIDCVEVLLDSKARVDPINDVKSNDISPTHTMLSALNIPTSVGPLCGATTLLFQLTSSFFLQEGSIPVTVGLVPRCLLVVRGFCGVCEKCMLGCSVTLFVE